MINFTKIWIYELYSTLLLLCLIFLKHMQTDEYFATQSEKVVTSDRTLEHLRNSRLTKEKLEKLLANQSHVSLQHKKNIYSITNNYSTLFPMWYFIME